ncbi:DUF4132 domain-containing protein [Actinophytocola sp.]|uniref:DUF4132 domain-containing protein n=1 Tax=Actinophytocola sp. TaxID=1872138 RepID=UPI002D80DBFC|nr:DUF4132 domain-containing protein [Actinophytocola sp.]HET9139476.1 DUF4132 domain-containing protein [Actinophytocola sp.]
MVRRSTQVTALPDEDTFVLPAELSRLVHPRRGGRTAQPPGDPQRAARLVEELRDGIVEILSNPRGDVDRDRVQAHLDLGAADPREAAVLAAVTGELLSWENSSGASSRYWHSADFVDAWVARRGLEFAARAVMERQTVYADVPKRRVRRGNAHRGDLLWAQPDALASRLRALVAAATDAEYEAVVEVLAGYRRSRLELLVTAFLVPGRTDWVTAADAAVPGGSPLVLAALDDAEALATVQIGALYLAQADTVLPTLADATGPALAPFLAAWYDAFVGSAGEAAQQALTVLAAIPTDEAFELLLGRASKRWVRPALATAMARFPVRAARLLAAAPAGAELLRAHARAHAGLLAAAGLPDSVRARLDQYLDQVAVADPASLPDLLTAPPWTRKRPAAGVPVVDGLVAAVPPSVTWLPGEREEWLRRRGFGSAYPLDPQEAARQFPTGAFPYDEGMFLATGPDELTRPLLSGWRPGDHTWSHEDWLARIAARYELDAVPAIWHVATRGSQLAAQALLPFATAEIAAQMSGWLVRSKSRRRLAQAWFDRHPGPAAAALVPAALGRPGKERVAARTALRLLDPAVVTAAAAGYGEPAAAAAAALLAMDPLDVLPARIPRLPAWLDLAALPQLLLRDTGTALPPDAAGHVVTMLAISKPGEVYAGVGVVRELCTPDSLAEFAWSVFGAWQSGKMPAKDGWALDALGWFGDDETVRRLAPLIRAWPGEGGHARAGNGLDVLTAIGTDVALMHLHGIAEKVRFAALRNRAKEKIAQVAAELELTPDQLADRLVPDLGLDSAGGLWLDYGPRRFRVGFDERLVPYVVDQAGERRKDLPKPGARDDGELAPAAHKRFAALKKDVRTLAADQVRRLEQAMVSGRRWSATEFTDLLLGHPLLRHLVRRLVWAHFDGDRAALTFRVTEDLTLAGDTDDTVTLPDGARIGVAHPLHLGPGLAAWAEVFADYEISQPFAQLARPVHTLAGAERAATMLAAFGGAVVPTGKVLGLTNRGWRRGEPQDGGVELWVFRPVSGGMAVVVDLDPGIAVGAVDEFPEQKVEKVWLNDKEVGDWVPAGRLTFAALDPVTASEVLADLTELTGIAR